jgi:trigger factor
LEIIEVKSAVENLEPTKVRLTVEVDYDELKPSIDHAYKHIAEEVNVPGFRKGKVPPRIIDQRVGRGAVLEHAINDGLGGFYNEAVRANDLRPLGQPEVEVTKVPDVTETAGELHFTADVEIRPTIELPALDSLTVTVDAATVSDEDVAERLESLRERFGTLVGVDRPAQDGDFVVLDLKAEIDGDEIDAVSGVSYQIGSGTMLDGLDEALVGLSAGETTTFRSPLAGGEHEGSESEITVTATQVKERELPAADDDFAQLASEFDTIDELKDDLREQVEGTKVQNQAVAARDALLAAILDAVEVPIPSGVVEAEVHRHLEQEGRLEDDTHRAEVTEDTQKNLRNQIVLDTLAEQLEVQVSQQELIEYLVNASQQYGMDPNEFVKTIDQGGQVPAMVGEVARSKSLAMALRQVAITDGDGNVVDLSDFIGSDAADLEASSSDALADAAAAAAFADAASDSAVEASDTDEAPDTDESDVETDAKA